MDKTKEAVTVITGINNYRNGTIKDYDLIKIVCSYFDKIKDIKVTEADRRFLKYISNVVGVPHYFDLLSKFGKDTIIKNIDLNTFSAILYESTLNLDEKIKVHKYQKQILHRFKHNQINRFFLSASTSFGKTHIVFEIIKKMEYKNVVLIFPTIALLSENLEKLTSSNDYQYFLKNYTIHTLSEVTSLGENNLFIYTPERFLSFTEKTRDKIEFNFAFIDEVYKIDNQYIIDEEAQENERDVAYRLTVFETLKPNVDVLLAGPYIDFTKNDSPKYNPSFDLFLSTYQIELIDYNNYEIVTKSFTNIKNSHTYPVDEELTFTFLENTKDKRLIETLQSITAIDQNSIVYCYSKASAERYAKKLIDSKVFSNHNYSEYSDFLSHATNNFGSEWILIKALKHGIGIHHGLIPKYLQKEIVSLFNNNQLKILISTTTITEGVNTSAKNLIVLHSKKGDKELKKFDAKNIAGRAGRFLHHYSGRVIVLKNDFMNAINSEEEGIKHKNYDLKAQKDEVDLFFTGDEFLNSNERRKKKEIQELQEKKEIPDFVFTLYKVVSRSHKIQLYDNIRDLSVPKFASINKLISTINSRMDINHDGFQTVLNIVQPIVRNQKLNFLINTKDKNEKYSILTHLVHYYLKEGFSGSIKYKLNNNKDVNDAISETSDFVYNILKYHVVKYLGVFNVMYKLFQSKAENQQFEEVSGIDRLLTKLEYNALSPNGRVASDYGVPSSIVDYYERIDISESIREKFDTYEKKIFERVEKIIKQNTNL